MQIDNVDLQILKLLQEDGKMTNVALAKEIGISPPPTLERVKKLEKSGVIRKYVALVEPEKVGISMHTFVEIKLIKHTKEAVSDFFNAVGKMDEIMECHHVTGDADFLLKIAVKDIPAFEDLVLHSITELPYIGNIKTMVVLSTIKNETAYNLEGVNKDD